MSHIDDLQRLLGTDLAMEFLLRQCVKPLFNTLCIMSYHIARYRYTSLSSHSIMYQSYGQDKFIFGWSPTRVFQAHTKRPLWHFTLCDAVRCCAMLCDAVRLCLERERLESKWGRTKGIYIAAIVGDEGESANSHVRLVDSCQDRPIALFLWRRCNVFTLLMRMRPK